VETGWLLERGSPPLYLCVSFCTRRLAWSYSHEDALRFTRKQDAEAMICVAPSWADAPPVRAAEHVWF
jgi:hypothetical protein